MAVLNKEQLKQILARSGKIWTADDVVNLVDSLMGREDTLSPEQVNIDPNVIVDDLLQNQEFRDNLFVSKVDTISNPNSVDVVTSKGVSGAVNSLVTTYNVLQNTVETDEFSRLVKNIYITGYALQAGQRFDITYFGLNSAVGFNGSRFGIQIGIRQGDNILYPTNYTLQTAEDVAGKTLKLYGNGAELDVAGTSVYIEVKDTAVIGNDVLFGGVTGYFDLPYVSQQSTEKGLKMAQFAIEEAAVKTYKIIGPTSGLNLFSKVVENIYITGAPPLAANERFSLSYIGFNTTAAQNLGVFMVQLVVVNTGDNSFYKNSNYCLFQIPKQKQFVELLNKDGELGTEGVRMFVKFKNFDSFPGQNILEGGQTQSILFLPEFSSNDNALLIDNRRTYTIKEKTAGSDFFNTYVEEIYINSSDTLPFGSQYTLIYTAANYAGLGKFMIQVATLDQNNNAEKPSNYYLEETPKNGEIMRLIPKDGDLMATTDVFIKFKNANTYPVEVLGLYYISGNIGINSYSHASETAALLKNVGKKTEDETYIATVNPTGPNAIQEAIIAAPGGFNPGEAPNKSVIGINPGIYEINNSSQFIGGMPGYPAMVTPKDNMHLIGTNADDCIVRAKLPYNDEDIDTAIQRNLHQTFWVWQHNCIIENLTIEAYFMRYTVHQDDGREANGERWWINCIVKFLGDKSSMRAFGIGTHEGSITHVWGGKSVCDVAAPVAIHNGVLFGKKSKWDFKDHQFINGTNNDFLVLQNSGALIGDMLELNNCDFGASYILDYIDWWINYSLSNDCFNHADWRITGRNNNPFLFRNSVLGYSLAVKSSSTGNASVVSFDVNSSAYPYLIANKRGYYGNLSSPERQIKDKYIYCNGSAGLSGYAIGCIGIREDDFLPFGNSVASAEKLGKRLGDCSVANKVLGIIIDGTTHTVTFNQDYTNFTNAQVLAEINAVLGSAGIAYQHNIGREYYAELTDCMTVATNNSTTDPILKGTVVANVGGRIQPANGGDVIYGVALDDIPAFSTVQGVVRGKGRVMIRNYISVTNTDAHFALADADCTLGDKYRVQAGQLVRDNANGAIRCIANSIVAINC